MSLTVPKCGLQILQLQMFLLFGQRINQDKSEVLFWKRE
jgi:hypothetical protein